MVETYHTNAGRFSNFVPGRNGAPITAFAHLKPEYMLLSLNQCGEIQWRFNAMPSMLHSLQIDMVVIPEAMRVVYEKLKMNSGRIEIAIKKLHDVIQKGDSA
ncbi:uncharacterized protein EI90DRAFT_2119600 [Cantharellus anzutake]|uniref:uncharacterized protein n=1 Tax=Cantharellus anzutake TaxID=1750568 RepID=UPI001906C324|nr:uncharacterized protein EI90DRAFT_2119600 [Cantharellus anzutake]KAF8325538.1 hypothetical protein EI90DRAFT_2119600 [Cantharellus anzutake]